MTATGALSIYKAIDPEIYTDVDLPWKRSGLTNIRLQLFGQSPPLRPRQQGRFHDYSYRQAPSLIGYVPSSSVKARHPF